MEKCASTLQAFPPSTPIADHAAYQNAAKVHLTQLSLLLKDGRSELIAHGPKLLELLDPAVNSLSYLAVIHTLILPGIPESLPRPVILEKLVLFLLSFDSQQIRYAGSHLQEIMVAVSNGQLLPPSIAVEALASAILRIDPTGSMLTSHHILLARLAYNTDNIDPALQVIDKSIVFYPNMANYREGTYLCDMSLAPPSYLSVETELTSALKAPAIMEYDLLSGMMYCAKRNWSKAFVAFQRVVTFPTRDGGTSKIMVEAFKKWLLVSLLLKGRQVEPPSYCGNQALKVFKILSKPYINVASLFISEEASELKKETEQNASTWLEDNNSGLIQEVLSAYQMWQILNLQKVYSKISISEIREQTKSAETGVELPTNDDVVSLVQNMVISGMLKGVIEKNDNGTPYLDFLPPTPQLSEDEFRNEFELTAKRLMHLQPILKSTNERLSTHKDYVKRLVKDSKQGNKDDQPDPLMVFQADVEDEDLMSGIVPTG